MPLSTETIQKLLLETGIVTKEKLPDYLKESKDKKVSLEKLLITKQIITPNQLGRLVAEHFGVRFVDLTQEKVAEQILKIIPELVAKTQRIIAFGRDKEGLKVAMEDPLNGEMVRWLEKKTGDKVIPFYTTSRSIDKALVYYRDQRSENFETIISGQLAKAKKGSKAEDVPIIKIVDTILDYAYENKASDIHIEPHEDNVTIRFRIDGILHDIVSIPKFIHNLIVTRIKVLSNLRTDEHRAAQDGKFRKHAGDEKFDVRVSLVPIVGGEKVVMRLLSERAQQIGLENLGFSRRDLEIVEKMIDRPNGMLLSTGPTGSGKTTTLYSIIKILNKPEVNISTIEDPVEYELPRVNQIQVNKKTGLTFATGLRAIVRQDPDIVMVGEIRDEETASIAVNSAMTGHLVLSTLHTNDAATSFPRLSDMGIKPFLVASAVNLVIAQRLVRKICMNCIESYEIDVKELEYTLTKDLVQKLTGGKDKIRVYRGRGCKECGDTGYKGRVGIYEVLEVTEAIKELVMKRANAHEIEQKAIEQGMTKMVEDGIDKVFKGITTIEEVFRVSSE